MNLPLFIARRYLFSRKSTHAINAISLVSVVGVAVATMALVVTLSVFNGFHDLVATLFTQFDPQLKVEPRMGKTAPADDPALAAIKSLPQVAVATETVEDQALAVYGDRQAMVTIKGVSDNFDSLANIRGILVGEGEFVTHAAEMSYGILGIRLAEALATGLYYDEPLRIYAPKREGQPNMANPMESFVADELYSPGVVFGVMQAKYDRNYIITSLGFARNLFGQQGMVSALELRLRPGADIGQAKAEIERICGDRFTVSDRYEQQEDTFRIMNIEKLIAYVFLTFILAVACFNIIGSLSMLIIDKQADTHTLRCLGATNSQLKAIFAAEGRMIVAIGALAGVALGLLLCWLQQRYGLVGLGRSSGSFIIDAYPVSVHLGDIVLILATVLAVGFAAVWFPVRQVGRR